MRWFHVKKVKKNGGTAVAAKEESNPAEHFPSLSGANYRSRRDDSAETKAKKIDLPTRSLDPE